MAKDWTEIEIPWIEMDDFAKILVDKINILDILDNWKIEYYPCSSGDFTHRMKCPLPMHAGGKEKTASCYVSKEKNKFYCFGCNSGGNIIDLVGLYTGRPFYEAMRWLASYAKLTKDNISEEDLQNIEHKEKRDPEKTVGKYIYRSGVEIREFLDLVKDKKDCGKWNAWADKRFAKLDSLMNELSDNDWEVAKTYYEEICNFIKKKSK